MGSSVWQHENFHIFWVEDKWANKTRHGFMSPVLVLGPGDLLFSQSQSCFLINLQHQMQDICCTVLTEPPWPGMGGGSCLLPFSKPLLWIFLSPMWDSGERDNGARKMGLTSDMYFGLGIKVANFKLDERLKPTKYPTPGEWVNKMRFSVQWNTAQQNQETNYWLMQHTSK